MTAFYSDIPVEIEKEFNRTSRIVGRVRPEHASSDHTVTTEPDSSSVTGGMIPLEGTIHDLRHWGHLPAEDSASGATDVVPESAVGHSQVTG